MGKRVYLVDFHPIPEKKCVNIYGFDISSQKEFEGKLKIELTERKKADSKLLKAYEQIQMQSEDLQVFNEELQVQSEELQETNQALNESEKRFRTLAENSPDVITHFDRQNRHVYANPAASEAYGFSQEEIIGKTHGELGRNPELVKFLETYQEIVFTTGKPEAIEFQYTSPQGKEYYFNTKIVPEFAYGKVISILAISRDITERKKIEEALKKAHDSLEEKVKERTSELEEAYKLSLENEKKLDEAQEMAHIGNWNRNLTTNELYWSDETYRIFGFKPKEFVATYDVFLSHIHLDDRDYVDDAIKNALNGKSFGIDFRIILADGAERVVHAQGGATFDEKNMPIRVKGTIQDITERKRAEETLQASEKRLRLAQQAARIGTFEWNIRTGVNIWTPELETMYGLRPGEFGKTELAWEQLIHSDDRPNVLCMVEHAFQTGEPTENEWRVVWPDGSMHWLTGRWQVFKDADGQPLRMTGVNIDITEQKRIQEQLRLSEEKFSKAFAINPAAISMTRLEDGLIMEVNDIWLTTFGYSRDEVIGLSSISQQIWPMPEYRARFVQELREKGSFHARELMFLRRSGEPFTALASAVILTVEGKEVVLSTWLDITKRKQAEEALLQKEKELNEAQRIAHVGSWYWDAKTDANIVSDELLRIFGQACPPFKEQKGTMYPPESWERLNAAVQKAVQTGVGYELDLKALHGDGHTIWITTRGEAVRDANGVIIGLHGTVQDITERKKAEETLAKIEIVRKQEIHHRIKNNLQVISSLLDLQTEQFRYRDNIKDSEVMQAFKESQDRVISMALIHEELYKSEGIDTLDFSSYIEELAQNLFLTYRLGNANVSLNMNLEENIFYDMDTAVPLGIIVNELVSNSLKHAFIGRDKGEIRIKLRRAGLTKIESSRAVSNNENFQSTSFNLTVSDNGVGIPDDLDIEDLDSLGFQLVTSLINQLDGEFELKRNTGTEFIIRFTVIKKINPESAPASQQLVE